MSFAPSTGFIIDNLNAGNSAYSNTVTVSVSSNASDGYILSATVGSTGTTCTGTLYQPGDYIKLTNPSNSSTNAVSLNAVWSLNMASIQSITISN